MNKKYYIYHIKGVKIGCTHNIHKRMLYQKIDNYEILETHTNIYKASEREIELQKEYGYKVDKTPYYKTLLISTEEGRKKGGKKVGKLYGSIGGKMHIESGHLAKIRKDRQRKVLQYTKNGEFIKRWESAKLASIELGIDNSLIAKVCKGKRKSASNYIWKYE